MSATARFKSLKGNNMRTIGDGLLKLDFLDRKEALDTIEQIGEIAPNFAERAPDNDLAGRFPVENFRELHQKRLLGLQIPTEYGGRGLTPLEYAAAIAAVAAGDSSTALALNMHSAALLSIGVFASEEQKRHWFKRVIEDGVLVAALSSEPNLKPIIDAGLSRTRLQKTADGYTLTGQKNYCSFGPNANLLFVVASLGNRIAFAVVDAHAEGIKRDDDWDVISMRSTASVTTHFQEVKLTDFDVIIPTDPALVMMLEIEFALGFGPTYLAIAAMACAQTVRELRSRIDNLIASPEGHLHPDVGIAFSGIGRMHTILEPAWLMCQKAARITPIGSFDRAAAIVAAKAVACDAACEAATMALRLSGGHALSSRNPVGRAFRDVQAGQVMAFSPAQARSLIGQLTLGHPPQYVTKLIKESK